MIWWTKFWFLFHIHYSLKMVLYIFWDALMLLTQEGSSQARYFVSRLIPAHKDPPYEQVRVNFFREAPSLGWHVFLSQLVYGGFSNNKLNPLLKQEARFLQLRSLTPEQRARLKSSFLHFDDYSFCEWMRSLNLVPPKHS